MSEYGLTLEGENDCLIAAFSGEITTSNYTEFRNDYNEVCRRLNLADRKKLVIDLTQTTFFGSLFVGMIVKLSTVIRRQGGSLALCGLSDQLNDLMKKLVLLERNDDAGGLLKHCPTRSEAVQALNDIED